MNLLEGVFVSCGCRNQFPQVCRLKTAGSSSHGSGGQNSKVKGHTLRRLYESSPLASSSLWWPPALLGCGGIIPNTAPASQHLPLCVSSPSAPLTGSLWWHLGLARIIHDDLISRYLT